MVYLYVTTFADTIPEAPPVCKGADASASLQNVFKASLELRNLFKCCRKAGKAAAKNALWIRLGKSVCSLPHIPQWDLIPSQATTRNPGVGPAQGP
jgi:hypothetical protein